MHVTGPLGFAADSASAFEGIDSTLLFATLGVVIIILLLTYRSPVLWLLPVLCAGVALTVAQAVIYLLAEYGGLVVNGQSAGILTVLVFGAGTDYALLLVARYREELRRHEDRHEAMAVALHRAGPAMLASGATVIVGMLCLLAAETNSTRSLGPVAAIGVLVALLVMITLLPALLVICGRWLFWPVKPTYGSAEPTTRGFWARIGNWIARRPRAVWVTTALVLGALSIGVVNLNANGLTNAESFTGRPDSIAGEEVIAEHFPSAGAGSPVAIVANAPAAAQVRTVVAGTDGISEVTEPVVKDGNAYLEGTLTDPPDSAGGVRDHRPAPRRGARCRRTRTRRSAGTPPSTWTCSEAAKRDRAVIIPIVLVVVLIILMVLLRAVVAPVMLIATVVLSFAAALGASALIFDWVFGFDGADSSLPLFVFVFLVALGIDYNIFLMTRVHEESQRYGTRRGALIGLAATGGVITSAGIVLAGTFAVLGDAAAGVPRRAGLRRRARRAAGHHHRPVGAGHRPQPGHRPAHLVAQQAGPEGRCRDRRAAGGAAGRPTRPLTGRIVDRADLARLGRHGPGGGVRRLHRRHRHRRVPPDPGEPGRPDADQGPRRRSDRGADAELVGVLDSIRGFAGDDIEVAVFYPEDDDFLIDRELTVTHYEVPARDP